jgi:hypothetical protein
VAVQVNWGNDDQTIACLHSLQFKRQSMHVAQPGALAVDAAVLPVSDISFNSTGWVLAVAYGAVEEGLGWSDQDSCIAVWNLARPLVNEGKPDHVLECPSCPVAVSFHPEKPAIVVRPALHGARLRVNKNCHYIELM